MSRNSKNGPELEVSVRKITDPVVTVHDALGFGGEGKEVFPVEAAGTAREAWVQLVEVVGACNHEDTVVIF